jgi:hypothetical protein
MKKPILLVAESNVKNVYLLVMSAYVESIYALLRICFIETKWKSLFWLSLKECKTCHWWWAYAKSNYFCLDVQSTKIDFMACSTFTPLKLNEKVYLVCSWKNARHVSWWWAYVKLNYIHFDVQSTEISLWSAPHSFHWILWKSLISSSIKSM